MTYGGQLGLKGQWNLGRLEAEVTGKVALGVTQQSVTVGGFDIQSGPGDLSPGYDTGFWYAQPSNIGTESRNVFSVVPQVQLKIGYNITANLPRLDRLRFPLLVRRRPPWRPDRSPGQLHTDCRTRPRHGPRLAGTVFQQLELLGSRLELRPGFEILEPGTTPAAARSSCAHVRTRAGTC